MPRECWELNPGRVCVCVCVQGCPWSPDEGFRSHGAGVTGSYEALYLRAEVKLGSSARVACVCVCVRVHTCGRMFVPQCAGI